MDTRRHRRHRSRLALALAGAFAGFAGLTPSLQAAQFAVGTFAPWPGKITAYSPPGGLGVRVDSAAYEGYSIPPHYDSLVAKLICFAETRELAIKRMQRALSEYVVQGIRTNIPFHRAALQDEAFGRGDYDTRFVERMHASETGTSRLRKAIEETP